MAAGDKAFWSDVANAIRPPTVQLIQQAAQLIVSNLFTALTFGAGSEDIDTDNFHDTAVNPSRITPTVAGYYLLAGVYVTTARADYQNIGATIRKNGAEAGTWSRRGESTFNVIKSAVAPPVILPANGSTDYFELFAYQVNAAAAATNSSTGGGVTSIFTCTFRRPL